MNDLGIDLGMKRYQVLGEKLYLGPVVCKYTNREESVKENLSSARVAVLTNF